MYYLQYKMKGLFIFPQFWFNKNSLTNWGLNGDPAVLNWIIVFLTLHAKTYDWAGQNIKTLNLFRNLDIFQSFE